MKIISKINGMEWPPLPDARAGQILAMLGQWEHTQWLPADEIRARQSTQLAVLVDHARRTVPFYRDRLGVLGGDARGAIEAGEWERIPIVTREDLQLAGSDCHSSEVPPDHGRTVSATTSGSTGRPLPSLKTDLNQFFWSCLALRDHLWQERDFAEILMVVREDARIRKDLAGQWSHAWDSGVDGVVQTGRGFGLHVSVATVELQADKLKEIQPGYFLSYPSNIEEVAKLFLKRGETVPGLKQIQTFGEILPPTLRALCRRAFAVPVVDSSSASEVGIMALQCPENEHYHIQSECILVEVLDEEGKSCAPGEVGKVVVSSLHNFAMPLIRYAIGDYAEVGEPCLCGRGLPVLKRILGRQRNMLSLPSGEKIWPSFDEMDTLRKSLGSTPPPVQFQFIQLSLDTIEVKLVPTPGHSYSEGELETFRPYFNEIFPYSFHFNIETVEEIPRSRGGKFEEFRSEIP